MIMKKWTTLLVLAALLFTTASHATDVAGQKMAIVNLQKALLEVNAGKAARDKLKKSYEGKKVEIDTEKNKWQADAEELKKQSGVLSQEAMQEKAQAMQKRLMDIQTKASNYERELAQSDAETTKEIISSLQQYVQELATAKGYAMVFENSAQVVLFAPNATDITQELIDTFNKKGMKK